MIKFPENFIWGAASSAYQIEGHSTADGGGLSIWDTFSHTPGRIKNADTGDVACDHYHRFLEDVALMKDLGLKAYRFSVSWSRLLPKGTGAVNEKGVQFYSRLIDALLEAGITPYMTLYHWDLPQLLQDQGGWANRQSAAWFAEYASLIAHRFGDRVKHYFTFNEPSVFIKGLMNGVHAPGLDTEPAHYVAAWHNILRAHGAAVEVLRAVPGARVGIAPTVSPFLPQDAASVDACEKELFRVKRILNGAPNDAIRDFINVPSMLLDPICFGTYPADGLEVIGAYLPDTWQEDMELICQPIDMLGVNTYNGKPAFAAEKGLKLLPKQPGYARTAIDWPVTPACLYWMPRYMYGRYQLPVYITENGLSSHDWVALDGRVHDPQRIDFMHRHLLELEKAIADGADVRGYFHWSLMDNFEWARGYFDRFGLIHVDYESQKRTVKDSGYWYKKVVETNGGCL